MADRPKVDLIKRVSPGVRAKIDRNKNAMRVGPKLKAPQLPEGVKKTWRSLNKMAEPIARVGDRAVSSIKRLTRNR